MTLGWSAGRVPCPKCTGNQHDACTMATMPWLQGVTHALPQANKNKIKTSYWQVVPENIATGASPLRDPSVKK